MAETGERYDRLARTLLESPDPVTALAHLIGDHEGRLDALVRRLDHVEAVQTRRADAS
jgi:hypothetical protein